MFYNSFNKNQQIVDFINSIPIEKILIIIGIVFLLFSLKPTSINKEINKETEKFVLGIIGIIFITIGIKLIFFF